MICKLQKLQNIDARLICRSARSDHRSPILRDLHWLPVESYIQYTIRSLTFKPISNQASSYLSDLIQQYVPSRQIRSSADTRLPLADLRFSGWHAFFYQSPLLWNNSLPSATLFSSLWMPCVWMCVRQCALLLLLLCGAGEVCAGSKLKDVEWSIVVYLFTSLVRLHCRAEHTKRLLRQLRWLSIEHRIKYKIGCLCKSKLLIFPQNVQKATYKERSSRTRS